MRRDRSEVLRRRYRSPCRRAWLVSAASRPKRRRTSGATAHGTAPRWPHGVQSQAAAATDARKISSVRMAILKPSPGAPGGARPGCGNCRSGSWPMDAARSHQCVPRWKTRDRWRKQQRPKCPVFPVLRPCGQRRCRHRRCRHWKSTSFHRRAHSHRRRLWRRNSLPPRRTPPVFPTGQRPKSIRRLPLSGARSA